MLRQGEGSVEIREGKAPPSLKIRDQKTPKTRHFACSGSPAGPAADPPADYRDRFEALTGQSLRVCPHCHSGTMVVIDCIARPKICRPTPDTS